MKYIALALFLVGCDGITGHDCDIEHFCHDPEDVCIVYKLEHWLSMCVPRKDLDIYERRSSDPLTVRIFGAPR